MGNRGAAKHQRSPMNGMIEKESSTPLAARPGQRRMPHERCSLQQLCFAPYLHMLLMQWGVMWSSWVKKWFKQGGILAQTNPVLAHFVACNTFYKSWPLRCPLSFLFLVLVGPCRMNTRTSLFLQECQEVLDADMVTLFEVRRASGIRKGL